MNHRRSLGDVVLRVFLVVSMLFYLSAIIQAGTFQSKKKDAVTSKLKGAGPADRQELESFLDEFIGKKMEEYHIPGLVFVLVKDGSVFFSKGYGYADLEQKKPVKPDETVFRVGSISKLFTATAAMQLSERGQIDLHADVNQYLKLFKLEENYPKPVTMAHLLTHSAGFRGRAIGSYTRKESERLPLGEFLVRNMPSRSMPPGSVINYSNHGFYLAGYLVEVISGIPFEQYIADNILQPLGMEQSSFVMQDRLSPNLAKGYSFSDGVNQEVPTEYTVQLTSPAGSLLATADDIARFMIAHLEGGRYRDQRILNENTCEEMQRQQCTNDPRLPGTCYGFYEYQGYHQRAIFHDGDVSGFSTRLFLLPEHRLGLFICNNTGNSLLRMQITDQFLSHYFPEPEEPNPPTPATEGASPDPRLAGSYQNLRLGVDSFDKLEIMSGLVKLTDESKRAWVERGPLLFQLGKSKTRLAFREDGEGNITHLFIDAQQMPIAYEKMAWYQTVTVQWVLIGFLVVAFLSAGVIWPMMKKIRPGREEEPEAEKGRAVRYALSLVRWSSVLSLLFIGAFIVTYLLIQDETVYGVPWIMTAVLSIPIVACLLTIGQAVFSMMAWRRKYWDFRGRVFYSLYTLTCIGFDLYVNYWNLLGFHY